MTKQPSFLKMFIITLCALSVLMLSALMLSLAIIKSKNSGMFNLHPYEASNSESPIINKKTNEIINEKALKFNASNDGKNHFMINEFNKIYRVKA